MCVRRCRYGRVRRRRYQRARGRSLGVLLFDGVCSRTPRRIHQDQRFEANGLRAHQERGTKMPADSERWAQPGMGCRHAVTQQQSILDATRPSGNAAPPRLMADHGMVPTCRLLLRVFLFDCVRICKPAQLSQADRRQRSGFNRSRKYAYELHPTTRAAWRARRPAPAHCDTTQTPMRTPMRTSMRWLYNQHEAAASAKHRGEREASAKRHSGKQHPMSSQTTRNHASSTSATKPMQVMTNAWQSG